MHFFKWLTILMGVGVIVYGYTKYPISGPQYTILSLTGFYFIFDVLKREYDIVNPLVETFACIWRGYDREADN